MHDCVLKLQICQLHAMQRSIVKAVSPFESLDLTLICWKQTNIPKWLGRGKFAKHVKVSSL
jgi:hypothetical protein